GTKYYYTATALYDSGSGTLESSPTTEVSATANYLWTTALLATGGYGNTLKVDGNGAAHVAFINLSKIQYATNASGQWVLEDVGTFEGDDTEAAPLALRIGASYRIVVYYDNGAQVLRQATYANSQWQSHSLMTSAHPYMSSLWKGVSLTIDSSDRLHATAYMNSDAIYYCLNDQEGGAFSRVSLEAVGLPVSSSLVLDSSNIAHALYKIGATAREAYIDKPLFDQTGSRDNIRIGGGLSLSDGGDPGRNFAIGIHPTDSRRHTAIYAGSAAGTSEVAFEYWISDTASVNSTRSRHATIATMVPSGSTSLQRTAISVEATGVVHIAFIDVVSRKVVYATNKASVLGGGSADLFVPVEIESATEILGGKGAGDLSIAVGANNQIHIMHCSGLGLRHLSATID
ncbi:MAG: hypothetical protein Q7N50_01660, partial [Armatimonadota bacterium]|nr:hypothetical protein [Armatimonadota bacterium]